MQMLRSTNILFLLLFCLATEAAKVTATIESWNSATLSGAVTSAMDVQFNSDTKLGNRITADHSANLSLSGWPACTVNAITMYVHSNSTAGAAMVMMSLADRTWLVAEGNFNQWPGITAYSVSSLPLSCLSFAMDIRSGSTLSIQIIGAVNSVCLERVEVDYTVAPPVPHTVTLQWLTANGKICSTQLAEPEALAGIELPAVSAPDSVIERNGETWYWQGWCEQPIATQSAHPLYWEREDWYGPEDDCTLYALYTNMPKQTLRQDSSFTSGEYAMAVIVNNPFKTIKLAMAGAWTSGEIAMQKVPLQANEQDEYSWSLTCLDDAYRYQLTFMGDSVTVYHPQSKTWIGYTATMGSNKARKWAWKKMNNGTILLYNKFSAGYYSSLCYSMDADQDIFHAVYTGEYVMDGDSYWYLFPTETVPSRGKTLYTTFRNIDTTEALPDNISDRTPCTKWLDEQGRIIIRHNNINYNLKGEIL